MPAFSNVRQAICSFSLSRDSRCPRATFRYGPNSSNGSGSVVSNGSLDDRSTWFQEDTLSLWSMLIYAIVSPRPVLELAGFQKSQFGGWRSFPLRSKTTLTVRAIQDDGERRRLVDFIRFIPEFSRNYFRSRPRRALFGGISLLGGFYVAQTISLSFGALGVNDVIAAVICVLLTEYATKFYYSRSQITFPVALLNNFKMGFTYGLFIDAFKLAS